MGVKLAAGLLAGVLVVSAGAAFVVHERHTVTAQRDACAAVRTTREESADVRKSLGERSGTTTAIIGDSYTAGQWLTDPTEGYAFKLAEADGTKFIIDGIGGSGFANAGPCGDAQFDTRLRNITESNVQTIILQGGLNDLQDGEEQAEATQAIRDAGRMTRHVIVVGSFAPPGVDAPAVMETNRQLRAASTRSGATFIDPSGWDYPVLNDRIHPTRKGHAIIARKLRTALQDSVRQS